MTEINASLSLPALQLSSECKTRHTLSLHHVMAACRFATMVKKLEEENNGKEFGDFFHEIQQHAMAVTMMSVAALESYLNELCFEGQLLLKNGVSKDMANYLDSIENKPTLEKYSLIFKFVKKQKLKKDAAYWENADILIRVRNNITHFSPNWYGEKGKHLNLSDDLKRKNIKHSPFLVNEAQLFPLAWASRSFCIWALQSTINFIDCFHKQFGTPSEWKQFEESLSELSDGAIYKSA